MIRREGYTGPITIISADQDLPVDRPNLSKDYLAGAAPEEWIPLRSKEFYAEHDIEFDYLLSEFNSRQMGAGHKQRAPPARRPPQRQQQQQPQSRIKPKDRR